MEVSITELLHLMLKILCVCVCVCVYMCVCTCTLRVTLLQTIRVEVIFLWVHSINNIYNIMLPLWSLLYI